MTAALRFCQTFQHHIYLVTASADYLFPFRLWLFLVLDRMSDFLLYPEYFGYYVSKPLILFIFSVLGGQLVLFRFRSSEADFIRYVCSNDSLVFWALQCRFAGFILLMLLGCCSGSSSFISATESTSPWVPYGFGVIFLGYKMPLPEVIFVSELKPAPVFNHPKKSWNILTVNALHDVWENTSR